MKPRRPSTGLRSRPAPPRETLPGNSSSGRIVVIGASTGGISALCELIAQLPADYPFPILVTIHIGPESILPALLNRCGPLEATHPEDQAALKSGCIFVAPPNRHLLVEDGKIKLSAGPRENRFRPAVDPLFRSAARAFREGVIGVILSGELDDGVAGLYAIKARGGVAIVQDPDEAQADSMPRQAQHHVQVDHCLPITDIAQVLIKLGEENIMSARKKKRFRRRPLNARVSAKNHDPKSGEPIPLVCPDCYGPLYESKEGGIVQFTCLVGHSYSPVSLSAAHADALERAIWVAIRTLKERLAFQRAMAQRNQHKIANAMKSGIAEDSKAMERDIELLEQIQARI